MSQRRWRPLGNLWEQQISLNRFWIIIFLMLLLHILGWIILIKIFYQDYSQSYLFCGFSGFFCFYCSYYYAFILDHEIISEISAIRQILQNEKLPGYLRTSAETAKGIIKFFFTWFFPRHCQQNLFCSKHFLITIFTVFGNISKILGIISLW